MADMPDRTSLPIRVHELLLGLAGRIDDDALTDARELLAVAESDRAIELVVGSLVAGRVPVSAAEGAQLGDLIAEVNCPPALAERLVVDRDLKLPRHRFTVGAEDDQRPESGVLDAVGRVLGGLPDVRSVSCVWRTTSAGATAGPVPQRLLLIETGSDGFAPSTAYRVEQALRRVGINAAVEVLAAGADHSEYHRAALAAARRLTGRETPDAREPRRSAASVPSAPLPAPLPPPPPVPPSPSLSAPPLSAPSLSAPSLKAPSLKVPSPSASAPSSS